MYGGDVRLSFVGRDVLTISDGLQHTVTGQQFLSASLSASLMRAQAMVII